MCPNILTMEHCNSGRRAAHSPARTRFPQRSRETRDFPTASGKGKKKRKQRHRLVNPRDQFGQSPNCSIPPPISIYFKRCEQHYNETFLLQTEALAAPCPFSEAAEIEAPSDSRKFGAAQKAVSPLEPLTPLWSWEGFSF